MGSIVEAHTRNTHVWRETERYTVEKPYAGALLTYVEMIDVAHDRDNHDKNYNMSGS